MIRIFVMMALLASATSAAAAMADLAHRSKVAGIDLITYRSNVKDVVVILGALPAGDAMADSGNIAIPTLSGMMLDRGTKSLDKFSIAEKLDNVGAEISFTRRRAVARDSRQMLAQGSIADHRYTGGGVAHAWRCWSENSTKQRSN